MEIKTEGSNFAPIAAKLSLYLPIAILPLDFIAYNFKQDYPEVKIVSWCVFSLMVLVGLILGIIAYIKNNTEDEIENKQIRRKSTIGIIVNAIFIMVLWNTALDKIQSNTLHPTKSGSINEIVFEIVEMNRAIVQGYCADNNCLEQLQSKIEMAKEQIKQMPKTFDTAFLSTMVNSIDYIVEPTLEYNNIMQEFETAGGMNLNTIQNKEDIKNRISILSKLNSSNGYLYSRYRTIEDYFQEEMSLNNFEKETINQAIENWQNANHHELIIAIHETDKHIFKKQKELFSFLLKNWGKWEYSNDSESMLLENNSLLAVFYEIHNSISKLKDERENTTNQIRTFHDIEKRSTDKKN